jgi:multiple sugar transport system substrate-binding protein
MNHKIMWTIFSLVLIVSVGLASCGGGTATQAPAIATQPSVVVKPTNTTAPQMVTIRWRTRPDNQAEQDVYQKISDSLNTQLASQSINLVYDPSPVTGYEDKLKTEYSAGTAPDIAWVPGASSADYAQLGVITDLMPLAKADSTFKLTDYYDAPMRELQNSGHLWGLPRDISTLVIYYNKDLFKKYNVDDPATLFAQGKWDWANFQRVAQELTHPDDKIYGFSVSDWWGLWGWFVYSGGGSLFNADRTACGLTEPGSLAGLQFMADLFLGPNRVAPPPGLEGGVGETEFHAGTVGMFPNGRWMTPSDRTNDAFDWAVVEMPKGPGGNTTWLFWGAYVINAKTQYPQQAWTVLKALTSPDVQAQVAALGTNIPSNKAQAAVDAFLNSKPPADNTPFINGAAYAQAEIPLFTGNWNDIVGGQYQPNIDKIFAGQASVQEAAQAACDGANPLFKKP